MVGDNLEAELAPMSFSHNDGGKLIKDTPIAYIPRLWEKIEDILNQKSDDNKGWAEPTQMTLIIAWVPFQKMKKPARDKG